MQSLPVDIGEDSTVKALLASESVNS